MAREQSARTHLAVILAAGRGNRLGNLTEGRPKGLINVGGDIPMMRSVANLRAAGIRRILIGTGYRAELYERWFRGAPDVVCIPSDRFDTTGSLYTLYNLREQIDEDFLLLESDLLYEQAALGTLLNDLRSDLILASSLTAAGDEVFIETDRCGNLVNLSKRPDRLKKVDAELVGISKLSFECATWLFQLCESVLPKQPELEYEAALVQLAGHHPLGVLRVDDLAWCEIDDESHYARAVAQVLPRIEARDARS